MALVGKNTITLTAFGMEGHSDVVFVFLRIAVARPAISYLVVHVNPSTGYCHQCHYYHYQYCQYL